jgi:hypothetical protein
VLGPSMVKLNCGSVFFSFILSSSESVSEECFLRPKCLDSRFAFIKIFLKKKKKKKKKKDDKKRKKR